MCNQYKATRILYQKHMLLDVLQPLLVHGVSGGNLDVFDLCNLACTCKTALAAVDWTWIRALSPPPEPIEESEQRRNTTVKSAKTCSKCTRRTTVLDPFRLPEDGIHLCTGCQRGRGAEKACRTYRLTKEDIAHLSKVRVAMYPAGCINTVDPRAVLGVAILKHGGPQGLREAMLPKRMQGKAYKDRLKKLDALELSEPTKERLSTLGLEDFLRNGKGGIKNIVRLCDSLIRYDGQAVTERML